MQDNKPHNALGFLGGSFDPPHLGHVILARDALDQLGLERLYLIPAGQSPLRDEPHKASFEQRLAMCKALCQGHPWLDVLPVERDLPRPSYTINTARILSAMFPGRRLYWIVGADQYARLHEWKDHTDLWRLLDFAVASRPGAPALGIAPPGLRARQLRARHVDISSTELRQRLAQGLPIDHLVSNDVSRCIQAESIYK